MGKGFQHSSGRVIALGRLMLASLFLGAILTITIWDLVESLFGIGP